MVALVSFNFRKDVRLGCCCPQLITACTMGSTKLLRSTSNQLYLVSLGARSFWALSPWVLRPWHSVSTSSSCQEVKVYKVLPYIYPPLALVPTWNLVDQVSWVYKSLPLCTWSLSRSYHGLWVSLLGAYFQWPLGLTVHTLYNLYSLGYLYSN